MKVKSILVYIFGILLLAVFAFASLSVVEFYYAKKDNRIPKLSIKTDNKKSQYYEYNALFYKVYKCYSNDVYVKSKNEEVPSCPRLIMFDDEGYYTTNNNVKISRKNYQLMLWAISSYNLIESMSKEEIDNLVYVSSKIGLLNHNEIDYNNKQIINGKTVEIHAFYDFTVTDKYGNYSWNPQFRDKKYYKCVVKETDGSELFCDYEEGKCSSNCNKLSMDEKWCNLASKYEYKIIKEAYNNYCR